MPFARSRQATIYYEIRGTGGPPLVLVRGFASSIRTWNGVDYDLARDHLTVVLDNRGTGRSAAPAGTYRVAQMAQDGLARALSPAHTMADGDTIFVLATGALDGEPYVLTIGALAADMVAEAILRSVRMAEGIAGYPSVRDLASSGR